MAAKETIIEITKRDYDGEFQRELLEKHLYWKSLGQTDKATAYLVLLHNFTNPGNIE